MGKSSRPAPNICFAVITTVCLRLTRYGQGLEGVDCYEGIPPGRKLIVDAAGIEAVASNIEQANARHAEVPAPVAAGSSEASQVACPPSPPVTPLTHTMHSLEVFQTL